MNICLNPVDQAFKRERLGNIGNGSIHLVRYADDMVILAEENLEAGIDLLNHYVERLGKRLNGGMTRRLRHSNGNSMDFLGFRFQNVRSRQNGGRLILVSPSLRSQERFRVKEQVANLNRYLRGWVAYFRLGHASATFCKLIRSVDLRVRHVIWRRKGRSGYGWGKLTSERI